MTSVLTSGSVSSGVARKNRCLVLGANGFIGTNLCLALDGAGFLVRGAGRTEFARGELHDRVEWAQLDFIATSFDEALEGVDVVVHLVSTLLPAVSNNDKLRDVQENLLSTLRLLDGCKRNGIRKIIFASSGGTVYGAQAVTPITEDQPTRPISSYGIVKTCIENYLSLYRHLHGLDSVSLRISNPFGLYQMPTDQGLVAALIGKALKNERIDIWGDGGVVRDYLHVSDVVDAIIRAIGLTSKYAPRTYNIGSGVGRSVNSVLDAVRVIHGSPMAVQYHPARAVDVPVNVLDVRLANEHLEWAPCSDWDDSLNETYQWLASFYA